MKIVYSNLPMKKQLDRFRYPVAGNSTIEYDGEVVFPVNSVLAKTLKPGERTRVVLLKKLDTEGNSDVNAGEFMKELNAINRNIGADIEYRIIDSPFEETRDTHEKLLRAMIGCLEDGAEIYSDITYGPKPLPIVLMGVLNFAEKFFGAKIRNIVYGKVDFITQADGTTRPANPMLYDITPLFYLNAVTEAMDGKNSAEAVKALDALLSM